MGRRLLLATAWQLLFCGRRSIRSLCERPYLDPIDHESREADPWSQNSLLLRVILVITCGVATLGCSGSGDRPDIGEVSGIVTCDGQPLANSSVAFSLPGFRPSIGNTNEQGYYELIYLRDIRGAAVGTHTVRIKQFGPGAVKIPRRYNYESELTAEVKPGANTINFNIDSNP